MASFRAHWNEDAAEMTEPARHLRTVSRAAPPRPGWGRLSLVLGVIGVIGTAAHFTVAGPVLLEVLDAGFALVLFVTLAGWVHLNRIALTRLHEPDTGIGRPRIRVLKSRDRVVRLDPDERVVLPYDFR
jgi:hypothetical protein